MSNYIEMKNLKQDGLNKFLSKYGMFAFSKEQFEEGLETKGFKINDLVSIGMGGYVLKNKVDDLKIVLSKNIFKDLLATKNNEEIKKAFIYELGNHEYSITYDLDDTLKALNITRKFLQSKPKLVLLMNEAILEYLSKNQLGD